jgi:hypothetical protein
MYGQGKPENWCQNNTSEQNIANFLPNQPITPMLKNKRLKSAAASQDPRVKMVNQIQKINSTFYGTLRANTIHKSTYD